MRELRLENLRCLRRLSWSCIRGLNLITGDNGSGKTSLLEAIYLLGRGRSFRTRHTEQLIRHASAASCWVHGRTDARRSRRRIQHRPRRAVRRGRGR